MRIFCVKGQLKMIKQLIEFIQEVPNLWLQFSYKVSKKPNSEIKRIGTKKNSQHSMIKGGKIILIRKFYLMSTNIQ